MGQKAAGTRRPRTKTTNPPPIQTKDMFTRTSTTLSAAALVALAVLACLATGASAQSRRLQGAPYFNANFGGGIGKLFGAATNDFMQGGVGAVTDAAVNSYHEVVPPAHFEKLLGRRAGEHRQRRNPGFVGEERGRRRHGGSHARWRSRFARRRTQHPNQQPRPRRRSLRGQLINLTASGCLLYNFPTPFLLCRV